jgi:CBS domain-containing protein
LAEQQTELASLFGPEQILCGAGESGLEAAARALVGLIGATDRAVDVDRVCHLVQARDRCGVMPVDSGAAVIHARLPHLKQLRVALAVNADGIACGETGDGVKCAGAELGRVHLLAVILAPLDDPAGYLLVVAALRRICHRPGFLTRVAALQDPEDVWQCFAEVGERLSAYVSARDIMRTDYPRLRDTDTLSDAIDSFCTEGVSELPVLDADGDLIGLVTEDELIRVCLPDYITWMDDLSPILNFEPFAEILRRESRMPVVEIMVFAERYATVDEDTPAIQVAKVMMRRDVRKVMVLREQQLVGIIAIHELIQRVLRA